MATWESLKKLRGTYTSPSFYISNSLDRYVAHITDSVINPHNQTTEYQFRVSNNNFNWSEWKNIHKTNGGFLDEYNLSNLYIQFRVVMMAANDSVKPYLQSFNAKLLPYTFIDNLGSVITKPKLWIRKRNGDGVIRVINHTTGQILEVKNLKNGEEIYIDCENEEIISSSQSLGVYRFSDHNDEYLELVKGENYITSEGDFDLDIRYKAILIQE